MAPGEEAGQETESLQQRLERIAAENAADQAQAVHRQAQLAHPPQAPGQVEGDPLERGAEGLERLLERLVRTLEILPWRFSVVVVDDASTDATARVARDAALEALVDAIEGMRSLLDAKNFEEIEKLMRQTRSWVGEGP